MVTQTMLSAAQELLGRHWREDQPPEQTQVLGLARDVLDFISVTGQRYRLEDFRKGLGASSQPSENVPVAVDDAGSLKGRMKNLESFFTKLFTQAESSRDKELILLILDSARFIRSTGQYGSLAEYLQHLEAEALPFVVAAFDTREEAEAWLRSHPNPPDFAQVLIANAYHDVVYDRETNLRSLPRSQALRHYLAGLEESEPTAASFNTREEADVWLAAHPEPPRRARVSIGGKPYLASYHSNIKHRVLYPLARDE